MEKKITAGVIGAGRMGKIHIKNIVHHIPEVKLKTVVDVKKDIQIIDFIKEMGVPNFTQDVDDIFNDPEIEIVVIASSTPSHIEFIQKAAQAKKDVFCEKPIDTDITRIKQTLDIVKEEGIKLMIGFNRRFDKNFKRVKQMVMEGQIGTPQIIKVTARDPAVPPIEYVKSSGGMFIDMTIHDWDMACYQVGSEVEEVYACGAVLVDPEIGKAGDIDTAAIILKLKNGAIGMIDNSRQAVYGYDQRVEVFGSKGCAIDNIPYFFLERYMDSYAAELQYFVECLQNNVDPKPNGEEGLQNVVVALAVQKSYEENRPIKISEIEI
jgi:myo-inositol 2-dehydrogenase/D-chiro-inositol 1-dehydrogenase